MVSDRKLRYIFLCFILNDRSQGAIIADIIDWAEEKLIKGEETTYICYLAGFTYEEAYEKRETFWLYFQKALRELDVTIPSLSTAEARNEYACSICRDCLAGLFEVKEAHDLLYDIWFENNYCAENSAIQDRRLDIWMYLADSLDTLRDGYGTLPGCEGLTLENYEDFFRREAKTFIAKYCNTECEI